jgi:hypothetical protein
MLKPFKVLKDKNDANIDGIDYTILINTEHITSLKPINIPYAGEIISGYWLRLLNGKKYKATRIPQELINLIEEESGLAALSFQTDSSLSEQSFQ